MLLFKLRVRSNFCILISCLLMSSVLCLGVFFNLKIVFQFALLVYEKTKLEMADLAEGPNIIADINLSVRVAIFTSRRVRECINHVP